jgi:hypothetical protein
LEFSLATLKIALNIFGALNYWNLVLLICGLDRSVCVWQTDAFAESWFKSHEKKEKAARHSFPAIKSNFLAGIEKFRNIVEVENTWPLSFVEQWSLISRADFASPLPTALAGTGRSS